jgi:Sec-independent protein translocase protein TatA
MFQGPELVLILIVAFLVFGLGTWPQMSRRLARLRLNYEKGLAEEAEVVPAGGETEGAERDGEGEREPRDGEGGR